MEPGERPARLEPVFVRTQQRRGLVGAPLEQSQIGKRAVASTDAHRSSIAVGAERLENGRLAVVPTPDGAQHGAVGLGAMRVQDAWPSLVRFEHRLGHDRVHSDGTLELAGAIAGRQHRAEALARDEGSTLAGTDRGHRLVESAEAFAGSPLRDEREAAVRQGADLEVGVAELDGQRQRPVGTALEREHIGDRSQAIIASSR